jgi:arylsulfatase A-like enzyme
MKHLVIILALLGITSARLPAKDPKRPNILLIYADDQSYKTLSCYPEAFPGVRTPNIDELAKSGVRFHAAYLGSWCMPSRATMLTGRQPHAIESMSMEGKYPGSTYDPKQCPFIPAQMRQQGYQTAQIGKWHTGMDAGWGRDWDYQIVWNRPKHPENAGAYYERQLLAFNGEERWQDGYPADNYTRWACEYIKGANRDAEKPWYLWLCYGNIHGPNKPAPRHLGKYAKLDVPIPSDIFPPRPGKPAYLDKTQAWVRGEDGLPYAGKNDAEQVGDTATAPKAGKKQGQSFSEWARRVNECLLSVDEGVGQLIEALKDSGQLENTLVVYTADQGFAMGEHGFRAKVAPYDANYRSPLIVSMPSRFPSGAVCNTAVSGVDLVATFLAISGVKVPWAIHGRDITPLLQKPDAPNAHPCFYEHMGQRYGKDVKGILDGATDQGGDKNFPAYVAVVQDGFKFIHYLRPEHGEELYDLGADPEELKNLIGAPTQSVRIAKLRATLIAECKRTEAPFELQP